MSQMAAAPRAQVSAAESPLTPESWGKLGMWVFLASDAMTFGGLLASQAALRLGSSSWPAPLQTFSIATTAVMTFFLLISSYWLDTALTASKQADQGRLRKFLLLTIAAGAAFLALQAYEWNHLLHQGLTLTSNPWGASLFGATFYVLTGFHGGHVFVGLLYLGWLFFKSVNGRHETAQDTRLELASLYWHFVYLVWIFIFTVVYLL
jgi:cytochrome c oxidase subunit 3